jgi:hypothetical protein
MNAFNYGDSLYVIVDMCGFKCAYVSKEGDMQVVEPDDLPESGARLPAEDEQQLCNEFMADLTRTLLAPPKVLKLDHNYVYLLQSQDGIKIDNIKWCYPFQDHEDMESLMDYIVSNIMHAGGTFWNVIKRPSILPHVNIDALLSPDTDADMVSVALEWNNTYNKSQSLEEILQAINLGPSTTLDVRAAVMDSCSTMEERIAILTRCMLS